jgi:hypothetical protein
MAQSRRRFFAMMQRPEFSILELHSRKEPIGIHAEIVFDTA